MDKRVKILVMAIAISLMVAIISTSYAFFTISNKTGSEETITSGTMALTLHDGAKVETNFMIPGEYIEKTFYVTNTGSLATSYDIYLSEVINDFADKTDLVYTLTSNDGGYSTPSQVQVPSTETKIVDSQAIGTSTTHHYTLRITFLNKNEAQDDNQGKHFSGKLQINEYQAANNGGSTPTVTPDVISGDTNTIGSELCLGDECFYLISNNNNTLRLLAKYNLDEDNGTYKQSEDSSLSAVFYDIYDDSNVDWESCEGDSCYFGYWAYNPNPENQYIRCLKSDYGTCSYDSGTGETVSSYPAYVFDEQNGLYSIVSQYGTYLNGLGYNISDIGLINTDDLSEFGCVLDYFSPYCDEDLSWLYNLDYYTGVAYSDTYVYYFRENYDNYIFDTNAVVDPPHEGIRPVIEIHIS